MGYIETTLQPGEELVYRTTPGRGLLRLGILFVVGVLFVLLAASIPVFLALFTQRLGRFPVQWGLPDSFAILAINVGLWLLPVLAFLVLSLEISQVFACELGVTDRRVLGRIPALLVFRQVDFPIDEIAMVSQAGSRVVIKLKKGQAISVGGFQNAGHFVEICRMRMIINMSMAAGTASARGDEPTQRLKRLREALDSGLISEIEYSEKRSEILKQI